MRIQIKKLEGQEWSLEVSPEMNYSIFRTRVADITEIPEERLRILFRGRELRAEPQTPISTLGLADGLSIHVIARRIPVHDQHENQTPAQNQFNEELEYLNFSIRNEDELRQKIIQTEPVLRELERKFGVSNAQNFPSDTTTNSLVNHFILRFIEVRVQITNRLYIPLANAYNGENNEQVQNARPLLQDFLTSSQALSQIGMVFQFILETTQIAENGQVTINYQQQTRPSPIAAIQIEQIIGPSFNNLFQGVIPNVMPAMNQQATLPRRPQSQPTTHQTQPREAHTTTEPPFAITESLPLHSTSANTGQPVPPPTQNQQNRTGRQPRIQAGVFAFDTQNAPGLDISQIVQTVVQTVSGAIGHQPAVNLPNVNRTANTSAAQPPQTQPQPQEQTQNQAPNFAQLPHVLSNIANIVTGPQQGNPIERIIESVQPLFQNNNQNREAPQAVALTSSSSTTRPHFTTDYDLGQEALLLSLLLTFEAQLPTEWKTLIQKFGLNETHLAQLLDGRFEILEKVKEPLLGLLSRFSLQEFHLLFENIMKKYFSESYFEANKTDFFTLLSEFYARVKQLEVPARTNLVFARDLYFILSDYIPKFLQQPLFKNFLTEYTEKEEDKLQDHLKEIMITSVPSLFQNIKKRLNLETQNARNKKKKVDRVEEVYLQEIFEQIAQEENLDLNDLTPIPESLYASFADFLQQKENSSQ